MTADGVDDPPGDLVWAIAANRIVVCFTMGIAPAPGAAPPPDIVARLPALLANSGRLVHAGALLAAGTDAGIGPFKPPDVPRWAKNSPDIPDG